ncbi:MAG: DUF115 domain-containing protein [Lachnospiraceae bacterium]|nr:DUF115 domain-containing protein [Lachnospiraceae bacterium]
MKDLFYKNAELISRIEILQSNINYQRETAAINDIFWIVTNMPGIIEKIANNNNYFASLGLVINFDLLASTLADVLSAQKNEDFITCSDVLNTHLKPVLLNVQGLISGNEDIFENYFDYNMQRLSEKDSVLYSQLRDSDKYHDASPYKDDIYMIENSQVGYATLAVASGTDTLRLHSFSNPMISSRDFVCDFYNPSKSDYIIFGLGLGYHCEELVAKDSELNIKIIENDIGIIELAMTYTNMNWYFNNKDVEIIYDPDFKELGKAIEDIADKLIAFHRPSVRRIKNSQIVDIIKQLWVREDSAKMQRDWMESNFLYNIKSCNHNIDSIKDDIHGKNVIIVAAGPSLDKNIDLLKPKHEDVVILALSAVCRKLVDKSIDMDYIVVSDAKPVMNKQFEGIESLDVPMLALSTTSKKVTKMYSGNKYLMCQSGFPLAEKYARDNDLELFETGGSVVTFAIDLSVRFGAKKIVFVGLDLAYTDNKNHATGAGVEKVAVMGEEILVEDVNGNMVATNRPFDMFRKWIEKRIRQDDVTMPIIDASEGGAKIKGAELHTLEEVMDSL